LRAKFFDVIIVGGGVIGCSIAYQLSKQGKQVLLLDRGKVGGESSQAAAGMLGVQAELDIDNPLYKLAKRSRNLFPSIAEELREITGRDILLQHNGMLKIAQTEEAAIHLKEIVKQQQSLNEEATWLTKEEVLQIEPSLSEHLVGGIHFPNESNVSAVELTTAFAEAAVHYGTRIKEYSYVENLVIKNDICKGIQTNYGEYAAEHVVLATGAWSSKWLPDPLQTNTIYPVKGEAFLVRTNPVPIKKTIFGNGCYIVPKKGGELLIGATMKSHTFNKEVSLGGISELMQKAMEILPCLSDAEVSSMWAGIRPMTSDGIPIIGPHPEIEGVTFATGHFRNGILLSPITGHLVANQLLGIEQEQLGLDVMNPNRFFRQEMVMSK
jgi:glycine oxidase